MGSEVGVRVKGCAKGQVGCQGQVRGQGSGSPGQGVVQAGLAEGAAEGVEEGGAGAPPRGHPHSRPGHRAAILPPLREVCWHPLRLGGAETPHVWDWPVPHRGSPPPGGPGVLEG